MPCVTVPCYGSVEGRDRINACVITRDADTPSPPSPQRLLVINIREGNVVETVDFLTSLLLSDPSPYILSLMHLWICTHMSSCTHTEQGKPAAPLPWTVSIALLCYLGLPFPTGVISLKYKCHGIFYRFPT